MKNITLTVLFALSAFWFVIATIDSIARDAGSFAELGLPGKICVVMFCICFGLMMIIGMFAPFAKYITTKIQQLWS